MVKGFVVVDNVECPTMAVSFYKLNDYNKSVNRGILLSKKNALQR